MLAHAVAFSQPRPDAGVLALVLLISLIAAAAGQYVGWRAWRNPYKALLVAGPTFVATFGIMLNIVNSFSLTG